MDSTTGDEDGSECVKRIFLAKMSFKDLDIGGIRPFDVNSDPSCVGTEWKRLLCSFQLYAAGKVCLLFLTTMTTKYREERFFTVQDRMFF